MNEAMYILDAIATTCKDDALVESIRSAIRTLEAFGRLESVEDVFSLTEAERAELCIQWKAFLWWYMPKLVVDALADAISEQLNVARDDVVDVVNNWISKEANA